ncbi:hypothetical protein [Luteimonas sp. R10]|uniref:hypothetical protein n=1 Tax=Luteimonas sp. R10 TaxID=3108176 RepID=UPI00308882C6|nr:hypothetical protein U3649_10060 [Luteimonas sp. R10]
MPAHVAALPADGERSSSSQWVAWLLVAALIYLLLAAVGAIGDGFKAATGNNAKQLFAFATNPFVGLRSGWSPPP